jgi:hypothetical protein
VYQAVTIDTAIASAATSRDILSTVRADDLAAPNLNGLQRRTDTSSALVDQVTLGCAGVRLITIPAARVQTPPVDRTGKLPYGLDALFVGLE